MFIMKKRGLKLLLLLLFIHFIKYWTNTIPSIQIRNKMESRKVKKFLIWFDQRWFFKDRLFEDMDCEYHQCQATSTK